MPTYFTGCVPPKDLANRARVSFARNVVGRSLMRKATAASFDWRDTPGVVPAIRDQSSCGSCWAFAGVGIAEMASAIAGGSPSANWSEQSVLDCGSNGGCEGDWPETALEQCKNSGIANESDYPYRGGVGSCRNVPHPNLIDSYGYVGPDDSVPSVQSIKDTLLARGPLAVAVAADSAFMDYTSGIFRGTGSRSINHAVILVGWNDGDGGGSGHWIMRNSWGTGWGESGFMRIAWGANLIGYGAMWASGVRVAPVPVPPVPPSPPIPPVPPAPVPTTITVTGRVQVVTVTTPARTITVPGVFGSRTITIPGETFTVPGQVVQSTGPMPSL